ncbi:MAG: ThiF family adenylyltransferase [Clostridium sp.]|nr:ThiF family adenylyltransferase [Clostridium sp.]
METAPTTTPLYYIDGEELKNFIASDATQADGFAYEWEGENVIHLRFSPARHGFGITRRASFAKPGATHSAGAEIRVDIAGPRNASVDGVSVELIPPKEDLYRRAKGLLEVGTLADRRVLIIGLGSGGAPIAVDLAKAGVGHFVLADFDRVELHNLSRHICDVNDLGRLKTDAVADAILGKNPYAEVVRLPIDINDDLDLLDREIAAADVVMVCTDNNTSRYRVSELLVKNRTVGIFGRAVTRAEGGDVFIYRPGQACYFCLLGTDWFNPEDEEITNYESAKRSGQIPAYVSEADAEAFVQVGLSSDIEPITNMMVKLALVELSRGTDSGINVLEEELTQNYYMWANRRERQYKLWGSFTNRNRMPTIMKWYGVDIARNCNCTLCNNAEARLTTDTAETDLLNERMGDLANINIPDTGLDLL